ncbi:MAG: hypothetical protein IPO27_03715 [Bacteroidetes bacterium]|nr:hypothetical protein [Bacteroidota bacterium]
MRKKTFTMMLTIASAFMFTNAVYAQWTTTGTVIRPTDTTRTVSIGTAGSGNASLYVEKKSGTSILGVRSLSGGATLYLDKSAASSNTILGYRTAGIAKWQTGMFANENYSLKNFTTGTLPMVVTSNDYVGIGNATTPAYTLHVEGKVISPTYYTLYSHSNYVGNSDIRGVSGNSVCNPGYGIGVEGSGGYMGVYGSASGSTYTGGAFGVYGYASGTAGTRYGVYGAASNSGGVAWAGYFSGNTYTAQLMVNTTTGANGYVASIGGKLIAEEVRVALKANWPDYVFADDYKLMSISELEKSIQTNKHLPGIPSACEVEENGLHLGDMQTKMVEKLEEAHLYIIQLQKQIDELKAQVTSIKK